MSENQPGIGDVVFIAIKPIAKMAVIALGGAFFARKGLLSPEVCKANASLVVNFLLPLLMFSTVTASFDSGNMKSLGVLLITGTLYQTIGLLFGFLVRWFTPVPRTWKGGVLAAGAFCNWGDLIIAIVSTLAKSSPFDGKKDIDRGTAYAAIFMVVQMLVMFNLGGVQLIERDFTLQNVQVSDPEQAQSTGQSLRSAASALADRTRKTVDLVSRSTASVRNRRASGVQRPPTVRLSCENSKTTVQKEIMETPNIPAHTLRKSTNTRFSDNLEFEHAINEGEEETIESQAQTAVNSISSRAPTLKGRNSPANPRLTPLKRMWSYMKPFLTPPSLSLIISLIIANVLPLKSLFVRTNFDMPDAPDAKPPLDFIMEICSFGGLAVPVLGMTLLGAALGKLSLSNLPKGFWKSVLAMAILKLVIGPIIGIAWTKMIVRTGLIDPDDRMLQFVMIICAGVPTATSQVYITNMFAPVGSEKSVEMSALSATLLAQYLIMLLTLTVLVSYTLMNVLQ
ncbi:auxin efflux carrier [Geopyxis carbonaria]|nr:auxin efflux carrier [Geopyxis carbonaria]